MITLALLTAVSVQVTAADGRLAAELRANDEILLRAVHRGGRTEWERLTTADFVYVEEGVVTSRADFIRGLEPDGAEPLRIRDFTVKRSGNTAVVIHLDDVPMDISDTRKGGTYLMTETWQRVAGMWKLRIVHIDAVRTDPPAVELSPSQINELVGTYRSGSRTYTIRHDGNRIFGCGLGQPEVELRAETRDVLFAPGNARVRWVFQRGADGEVTGLTQRDENSDVAWSRVR